MEPNDAERASAIIYRNRLTHFRELVSNVVELPLQIREL